MQFRTVFAGAAAGALMAFATVAGATTMPSTVIVSKTVGTPPSAPSTPAPVGATVSGAFIEGSVFTGTETPSTGGTQFFGVLSGFFQIENILADIPMGDARFDVNTEFRTSGSSSASSSNLASSMVMDSAAFLAMQAAAIDDLVAADGVFEVIDSNGSATRLDLNIIADTSEIFAAEFDFVFEIFGDNGPETVSGIIDEAFASLGLIKEGQSLVSLSANEVDGSFSLVSTTTAVGVDVVAPVPLPAGGLLLLTALGAVGVARRRKAA